MYWAMPMVEVNASRFDIPPSDAWIVQRLATLVSRRLENGHDSATFRRGLLRLLFALQRLPLVLSGTVLALSKDRIQIEINEEIVGVNGYTDDGHTEFRLSYFATSHDCFYWGGQLHGDARREAIQWRLQLLEEGLDEPSDLFIEDLSSNDAVDTPPMMELAITGFQQ